MSKKKKLIVLSSVLAVCMLCSLSVLALSGQEETANADENSATILSEGDTVQNDVLEKVVSEEVSEEQMTEIQKISTLSTVTTCEKVEEVLGKPISTCGSYDLFDEWSKVTKIYKTTNGEEIKVDYRYDAETDTEIVAEIWLSDGCYIISNEVHSPKSDLTTAQFLQFVKGETTYEKVISTVGQPCANTGSGFIWDVYYTTDGDKVCILYNHNIVDEIQIF